MPASDDIQLAAGDTRVRIARKGAEWRSWEMAGREWLWSGDARWWDEISPVLFPVVGWTRDGQARVDGVTYPLALHGFARHRAFALLSRDDASASFRLVDDAETRALYPFPFALTVSYAVEPRRVAVRFAVENTGARPMPYAVGFHPGFAWPLPGAEGRPHRVLFDAPEEAEVPVIAPGGLFAPQTRRAPVEGRRLPLDGDSFATQSMAFLAARSAGLLFGPEEGGPQLRIELEDLPHWVLWSRPGGAYLCIEGWIGWGDPVGFAGELAEKPGMRLLQPGESASHAQIMSIVAP